MGRLLKVSASYLHPLKSPDSKGVTVGNYEKAIQHTSRPWISVEASLQSRGLLSISFLLWAIMIPSMAKRKGPKGRTVG
jgi:hypothetical protein